MADEGFEERHRNGEDRVEARNRAEMDRPLEGPGSDERLRALQAKFRSRDADRMPTFQLILIGVFIFLVILLFGAGRFVIADLAPKPPPGLDLNALSPPSR
jgi:hypothetical protein